MSKEDNRRQMPTVAALVDELRAQGFAPKVIYAKENGREVGTQPAYREVFQIPKDYRKEAPDAPRRSR